MEPLTPLPATVVITLGLWLVGSLCSVWSSPIGRYPIFPELWADVICYRSHHNDGHGAHPDWLAHRVRYPRGDIQFSKSLLNFFSVAQEGLNYYLWYGKEIFCPFIL